MARRDKRPDFRPRRATRVNKLRVGFERWVLGIMMTVVAWIVERRLLKVLRSGSSSKKELERSEREGQHPSRNPLRPEAGVAAGRDEGDA